MIKRLTPKDLDRIVDAGVKASEGLKRSAEYYKISNKAGLDKFNQLIEHRVCISPEKLVGKKVTVIRTPLMYHPGNSYKIIDSEVFKINKVSANGTMMEVETEDGLKYRILTGTIKGVVIWTK